MDEYGQIDNEHFQWLWENRKCWAPVYYMKHFFPFLQTTARSEGFNAVLKKYVNPNNSLIEFATQYTAIQEKVMVAVAKEQVDTIYKEADMYSLNPIELQMRGIYTQNLFSKFQVEMKLKTAYGCDTLQDGTFRMWSLRGILPKYGDRDYHVQANKDEGVYSCTCCKFDRDGLLCTHILRVMEQIGVYEIPRKYILDRWTWDPEEDLVQPDYQQPTVKKGMTEEGKNIMRYTSILNDFKEQAKDACTTDEGMALARKHVNAFRDDMDALKKRQLKKARKEKDEGKEAQMFSSPPGTSATEGVPVAHQGSIPVTHVSGNIFQFQGSHAEGSQSSNTRVILDPPKSTTKGRPREKRFQHPFDIVKPKKERKCRVCGSIDHDKRKCTSPIPH